MLLQTKVSLQALILLPISKKYNEYCFKLLNSLKNSDIRGHVDDRNETTGKKIRDADQDYNTRLSEYLTENNVGGVFGNKKNKKDKKKN